MRACVLGLVVVLMGQAGAYAQAPSPSVLDQSTMSVSIFVTDVHGNPASSVTENDLSIEDEHQPRNVIRMTHDTAPLRVGVVIDRSNSQRTSDLYKAGVRELNTFLKEVLRGEADKAFIEAFDTVPDSPLSWMSRNQLGQAQLNVQPRGGSALFDAIDLACKERFADNGSPFRRLLILLTDGDDNQSRVNLDAAITAAQKARAAVFAISTREDQNIYRRLDAERAADSVLRKLAESTGGFAFLEVGPKQMPKVFSQIIAQLDSIFDVVFIPTPVADSRQLHSVMVTTASRSKLRVHAPNRYYATIQ